MHQETTKKFYALQFHDLFPMVIGIIFPMKVNIVFINFYDPSVADRNTISIARLSNVNYLDRLEEKGEEKGVSKKGVAKKQKRCQQKRCQKKCLSKKVSQKRKKVSGLVEKRGKRCQEKGVKPRKRCHKKKVSKKKVSQKKVSTEKGTEKGVRS